MSCVCSVACQNADSRRPSGENISVIIVRSCGKLSVVLRLFTLGVFSFVKQSAVIIFPSYIVVNNQLAAVLSDVINVGDNLGW